MSACCSNVHSNSGAAVLQYNILHIRCCCYTRKYIPISPLLFYRSTKVPDYGVLCYPFLCQKSQQERARHNNDVLSTDVTQVQHDELPEAMLNAAHHQECNAAAAHSLQTTSVEHFNIDIACSTAQRKQQSHTNEVHQHEPNPPGSSDKLLLSRSSFTACWSCWGCSRCIISAAAEVWRREVPA